MAKKTKYECQVLQGMGYVSPTVLAAYLNDGWEVIGCVSQVNGYNCIYLKRKVVTKNEEVKV